MADPNPIKSELKSETPSEEPAIKDERTSPAMEVDRRLSAETEQTVIVQPPSDKSLTAENQEGSTTTPTPAHKPMPSPSSPTVRESSPCQHPLKNVQPRKRKASQNEVNGPTEIGHTLAASPPLIAGSVSRSSSQIKKLTRRSTSWTTIDTNASRCIMCPGPSVVFCEACGTVEYCSEACRDRDDSAHDLLCHTWLESHDRPGAAFRRAIYFPTNAKCDRVSFVWLKFWHSKNQDDEDYQVPILADYFAGFPEPERRIDIVTENNVLCRRLECPLKVISCADQSARVPRNDTVNNLIDDKFSRKWKGPILVFGANGANGADLNTDDLDLTDYRYALDYLATHRSNAVAGDMRYFGPTVSGVRINCDGDRGRRMETEAFDDTPLFENVRVPLSHRLFHTNRDLPIPGKMGIPILSATCPRKPQFEKWFREENENTQPTSRCLGDYNQQYGDLSKEWLMESEIHSLPSPSDCDGDILSKSYYSGSVILARKDQKALNAVHVDALWKYNKRFLEEEMTKASSIHGDRDRLKVQKYMTKEAFELFYRHIRTGFSAEDRKKPSPYGVKRRIGSVKGTLSGPHGKKRMKYEWSSDGDYSESGESEE